MGLGKVDYRYLCRLGGVGTYSVVGSWVDVVWLNTLHGTYSCLGLDALSGADWGTIQQTLLYFLAFSRSHDDSAVIQLSTVSALAGIIINYTYLFVRPAEYLLTRICTYIYFTS